MTLHVVPPPASPVFRVARGDDGPPADPFGNRFDDPGMADGIPEEGRFRVIYAATHREAAFAETIAHFRPDLDALAVMRAIRGATGEPQPLTGAIPARWRQLRGGGRLLLDPARRFVDVAHPDTLATMRTHVASVAVALGHWDVDLSTITSGGRRLTQRVARYMYERTDAAGIPTFAGLRSVSRHGAAWECWARFADRLVGEHLPMEPVRVDDPALIAAARHLGLTILPDG